MASDIDWLLDYLGDRGIHSVANPPDDIRGLFIGSEPDDGETQDWELLAIATSDGWVPPVPERILLTHRWVTVKEFYRTDSIQAAKEYQLNRYHRWLGEPATIAQNDGIEIIEVEEKYRPMVSNNTWVGHADYYLPKGGTQTETERIRLAYIDPVLDDILLGGSGIDASTITDTNSIKTLADVFGLPISTVEERVHDKTAEFEY